MFLKRTHPPEPVLSATPPPPDPSVRRQGAVEALNLLARSIIDAVEDLRNDSEVVAPDNFMAGQFMALGQVMGCIERERDLLQQQLISEAGLHASSAVAEWDVEMKLLSDLPVTSGDLFRLAMDFRRVEEPPADEDAESEDSAEPGLDLEGEITPEQVVAA